MADYGLLVEVASGIRATSLTAAASISDTELVVDSAGDFDEDGGTLALTGTQLDYTGITWGVTEDDSDTIELTDPLTITGDVDDDVAVVSGGLVAQDWYAVVDMGDGDPVHVPLSFAQRSLWAPGIYDPAVPVQVSDDLQHLEDAPGRTPSTRVAFENTDRTVASADDAEVVIVLSHTPIDGSTHVRKNGVSLEPTEWTRDGATLVIEPTSTVVIRADDIFSCAYAYDAAAVETASAPATPIAYRDSSPGSVDAWTIPSGAVVGDLLVAAGMCNSTKTVNANGWTPVGESAAVTHLASSGNTFTYRMVVLTKVYDGTSTVPTVSAGTPQSVCLMVAFEGGAEASARFDTLGDGATADTPSLNPSSLRVWGTVANLQTITPTDGTQVGYSGGNDIDICMTLDSATGPRSASVAGTAGWCLASLAVR